MVHTNNVNGQKLIKLHSGPCRFLPQWQECAVASWQTLQPIIFEQQKSISNYCICIGQRSRCVYVAYNHIKSKTSIYGGYNYHLVSSHFVFCSFMYAVCLFVFFRQFSLTESLYWKTVFQFDRYCPYTLNTLSIYELNALEMVIASTFTPTHSFSLTAGFFHFLLLAPFRLPFDRHFNRHHVHCPYCMYIKCWARLPHLFQKSIIMNYDILIQFFFFVCRISWDIVNW